VCRRHNLLAQADSLIAQAAAWEVAPASAPPQPLDSTAPVPAAPSEKGGG